MKVSQHPAYLEKSLEDFLQSHMDGWRPRIAGEPHITPLATWPAGARSTSTCSRMAVARATRGGEPGTSSWPSRRPPRRPVYPATRRDPWPCAVADDDPVLRESMLIHCACARDGRADRRRDPAAQPLLVLYRRRADLAWDFRKIPAGVDQGRPRARVHGALGVARWRGSRRGGGVLGESSPSLRRGGRACPCAQARLFEGRRDEVSAERSWRCAGGYRAWSSGGTSVSLLPERPRGARGVVRGGHGFGLVLRALNTAYKGALLEDTLNLKARLGRRGPRRAARPSRRSRPEARRAAGGRR